MLGESSSAELGSRVLEGWGVLVSGNKQGSEH